MKVYHMAAPVESLFAIPQACQKAAVMIMSKDVHNGHPAAHF